MLDGQFPKKFIISLLMILSVVSKVTLGAEWSVEPSVQIKSMYDDNLYLQPGSRTSVWGGTVSPWLTLNRREENKSLSLGGRLNFNRYSSSEVNDDDAQYLTLGSHYNTQRDVWNLGALFVRDTTVTTVNDVIKDPNDQGANQGVDVNVNLVSVKVRRQRFDVSPSWTHVLSERTALTLNYRFQEVTFADSGNNGLTDYRQQSVDVGVGHNLTERDRLSVIAGASFYESLGTGSEDSQDYDVVAKWGHEFSQTLHGEASTGVHTTTSRVNGQNKDSTGALFNARLVKRYSELTTYSVSIGRSAEPSYGGLVRSDQLSAQWHRNLSPRMAGYFSVTAFRNKALDQLSTSTNRTYYSFEPGLRWSLTRWWSLDGSYRYRRQKYENSNQAAQSNAAFIAVSYAWPRIAASR